MSRDRSLGRVVGRLRVAKSSQQGQGPDLRGLVRPSWGGPGGRQGRSEGLAPQRLRLLFGWSRSLCSASRPGSPGCSRGQTRGPERRRVTPSLRGQGSNFRPCPRPGHQGCKASDRAAGQRPHKQQGVRRLLGAPGGRTAAPPALILGPCPCEHRPTQRPGPSPGASLRDQDSAQGAGGGGRVHETGFSARKSGSRHTGTDSGRDVSAFLGFLARWDRWHLTSIGHRPDCSHSRSPPSTAAQEVPALWRAHLGQVSECSLHLLPSNSDDDTVSSYSEPSGGHARLYPDHASWKHPLKPVCSY